MKNRLESLRQRAEDRACDLPTAGVQDAQRVSEQDLKNMLHELQVNQIELEMQNEELRQTQAQLDVARARYFDLYDMAPVGYCTVNALGLVLEANFMAATLFGLTRKELTRRPLNLLIVREFRTTYARCSQALADSGLPQACELQMLKKGGAPVWAQLKFTAALDADGAPVQRVVLNEITERKQSELALHAKNQELEAARTAAVQANRAKTDFLSNMSHELRSPLNAILGFAQLMAMDLPVHTDLHKGRVDQILKAGWYLLDLISEILDLTSIESGKLSLVLAPVGLSDLLADCKTALTEPAAKRDIRLQFAANAGSYCVEADGPRLLQVLLNLLTNAIQYNRTGGTVELSCSPCANQRLRITVRDTGEGLSPEKMEYLFQPFNRLGRETTAEEGTGVGLALSKRLVELMGGSIGARSTLGVGSTFWIELNCCEAAAAHDLTLNTSLPPEGTHP